MERYVKIGNIIIGKNNKYVFNTLTGIENGSVKRNETEYVGTDGAEISEIYFTPRTIEISGTVIAESLKEMNALKRDLIKACNPKKLTEIYYCNGENAYYAKAIGDSLPEFGKKISDTGWEIPFIAYMLIPGFFWESETVINTPLYGITPLLTASSSLPCVLSERINNADINNDGDEPTYPEIEIICTGNNENGLLEVENETTGKRIKINHLMSAGEHILINMRDMTVTSSINGNIINFIAADTDFWGYEPGINKIRTKTANTYTVSRHRNKYLGV